MASALQRRSKRLRRINRRRLEQRGQRPISVCVNEAELARVLSDLGFDLPVPRIEIVNDTHRVDHDGYESAVWGDFAGVRDIRIFVGYFHMRRHGRDALARKLETKIRETLLHELRHLYQRNTWEWKHWYADSLLPYHERAKERDARQWAQKMLPRYPKLVSVSTDAAAGMACESVLA